VKVGGADEPFYTCFSCGSHGDLSHLISELRHLGLCQGAKFSEAYASLMSEPLEGHFIVEPMAVSGSGVKAFPEDFLEAFIPALESPRASTYLCSRGVDMDTVVRLGLRYNPSRDDVVFPIRDWSGALVGARGRSISPHATLRYMDYLHCGHSNTDCVWLGENFVDTLRPLVLVEGNFDLASVVQVYPNVLASLTASLNQKKMARIASASSLAVFSDNDPAGESMFRELKKFFHRKSVHRVKYSGKDPGSLSARAISEALQPFIWL
jgi:DNA primase